MVIKVSFVFVYDCTVGLEKTLEQKTTKKGYPSGSKTILSAEVEEVTRCEVE